MRIISVMPLYNNVENNILLRLLLQHHRNNNHSSDSDDNHSTISNTITKRKCRMGRSARCRQRRKISKALQITTTRSITHKYIWRMDSDGIVFMKKRKLGRCGRHRYYMRLKRK